MCAVQTEPLSVSLRLAETSAARSRFPARPSDFLLYGLESEIEEARGRFRDSKQSPADAHALIASLVRYGEISAFPEHLSLGSEALSCALPYLRNGDISPQSFSLVEELLQSHGRLDDLAALYAEFEKRQPSYAAALKVQLALLKQSIGDMPSALELLNQAIELKPRSGVAHYFRAMIRSFGDLESAIVAAREHYRPEVLRGANVADGRAAVNASYFAFALGLLHDRAKQFDLAFECFDAGNRSMRTLDSRPGGETFALHLESVKKRQADALGLAAPDAALRPIFVTGLLPRSGTSLVESIFAAHRNADARPDILSVGEISQFANLDKFFRHCPARTPQEFAENLERWRAGLLECVRGRLEHRMTSEVAAYVDKSMDTFAALDLAARMFPESPMVIVTRNPLDSMLSIYMRRFGEGALGSTHGDLEALQNFYLDLQLPLLELWKSTLPRKQLLVVKYEDMVRDFGGTVGALLSHCGLASSPESFEPHRFAGHSRTDAGVFTPPHPRSIGGWKRYEKQLRAALPRFAELVE